MLNAALRAQIREIWARMQETARLMVGLPDYHRYVAHHLAHHPGSRVMSRGEFVRERMARRYADDAPGRCC